VEALADDLAALLDGLNIQTPVVLCGLSMGGYIAFAFYRKYASRLAGLILTATRAAADSPEARLGRDQAADRARQEGVNAIAAAMLPRLLAPQTYNERPELVQQVKEIMESTSLEGILGDLAALKQRPDSTPTLPKIRVPTLILHGQQDALIPLQEAQAMQAGIPGARLIAIPGAGHLPNLEQPELFNRAVIEFLQSL
jgi:pimeloyl-ACP methyl ester carboxylesterase